jgi:hypothetical protein
MKCPPFEDLLDYCDGHINEPAHLVVAHLESGCQQCAQDIDWYRRMCAISASDDCEDPPPWVFKRALRLFETRQTPKAHFGRLIASLAFDSFARPVLSGVRLVETNNRQLLYRAGAYTIDLQIDFSEPSKANLRGQILRESESRFESVADLSVRIIREGKPIRATSTNAIGEFSIQHLEQDDYDLVVGTKEGIIDVPRLPITPNES